MNEDVNTIQTCILKDQVHKVECLLLSLLTTRAGSS